MTDIKPSYIFQMTFTPPVGEPITQVLSSVDMVLLIDAIRRADRRVGRPSTPRDMKLKHMLQARDQIRRRDAEGVTQATLAWELGFESDRRVRRWLTELTLTWQEFLAMDDF